MYARDPIISDFIQQYIELLYGPDIMPSHGNTMIKDIFCSQELIEKNREFRHSPRDVWSIDF